MSAGSDKDKGSGAGAVPLPWESERPAMHVVSDREARAMAGSFEVYADRKAPAFVMLRSGLSHQGGRIQHILSVGECHRLGLTLLDAAKFASEPTFADRIAAAKTDQPPAKAGEAKQ